MNFNASRTLITVAAGALLILPIFLGCSSLPTGAFDCSQSWLPPWLSMPLASGLLVLGYVVKAAGGEGFFDTGSATFRTILSVLAMGVPVAMLFLGCTTVGETVNCSGGIAGPTIGGLLGGVFIGLNLLIKKFDGKLA